MPKQPTFELCVRCKGLPAIAALCQDCVRRLEVWSGCGVVLPPNQSSALEGLFADIEELNQRARRNGTSWVEVQLVILRVDAARAELSALKDKAEKWDRIKASMDKAGPNGWTLMANDQLHEILALQPEAPRRAPG